MWNMNWFIVLIEMMGTVAFAISGVVVAKKSHMDIFGAIVLGCVSAVGGGVIRDLILGNTPPQMFVDPSYVFCAFVTSVVMFIVMYRPNSYLLDHKSLTNRILNITDSLGLAMFVFVGCRTAIQSGYELNLFLCTFVGTVTGIGGGILRDIFAGQIPLIMRERVYGVAAVAGAMVYMYSQIVMSEFVAMIVCLVTTLTIRYLAIHFSWHLPRL